LLAGVCGAQFAAVMRSFEISLKIKCHILLIVIEGGRQDLLD
jgi:hypothetical protein